MTLNDELLAKIESYAKTNYMNRSSVVSFACNQFLLTEETRAVLFEMKNALKVIAEKGTITDEEQKELDKFNLLVSMLSK